MITPRCPDDRSSIQRQDARVERGIVAALQAAGLAAVRVPLSGAAGGWFSGDPLAGAIYALR
jgi:Holliday junction resolvase